MPPATMPETLLHAPALIKILGSLAVLLVVNRLTRSLALAAGAGILVLGLWCGHGWSAQGSSPGLPSIALRYLVASDTWSLAIAILLSLWLSSLMERSGAMADLVAVVRGRCRRRSAMAVLPAVIGWLPMPGGANFSAPLVDACDERRQVEPGLKALVNYWFRHIWEYWWPLYPAVLLATRITHLETGTYMLIMAPLSLASVAVGWLILLRRVPHDAEAGHLREAGLGRDLLRFVQLVAPILAVIAAYAGIRTFLPAWSTGEARYLPIILGLVLAIAVVGIQRRIPGRDWRSVLLSWKTAQQVLLTFLLCGFAAIIECRLPDGRMLAEVLHLELASWSVPVALIMAVIPFAIGIVTGIAAAFVAGALPIAIGLLGPQPQMHEVMATTVLAFGSGYAGILMSPVHFCLIQTNLHFGSGLGESMRRLIVPIALLLSAVVGWWAILHWWPQA